MEYNDKHIHPPVAIKEVNNKSPDTCSKGMFVRESAWQGYKQE